MMLKRRRQSSNIVEDERLYIPSKIAALRASSCVVKVTHRFKLDRPHGFRLKELRYIEDGLVKLTGSGIIIECEEVNEATYHSIVFTHATLFTRSYCETSNLNEIQVDVSLSDGKVCKTEIIACDFHYNLAALKVTSDTPLQPAKIRSLDDTISIDPTQEFPRNLEGNSFELRPHSNLFKYSPGVSVIALGRRQGNTFYTSVGSLSMKLSTLEFSDLFRLTGDFDDVCVGGPVINYSGEVIGIMLHSNSFLPSNIFLRWWKHYKSYRELRRPWIGFGVANLYAVHASHLEKFMGKFPSVSTGVFVEEVELDSPAYFSGIRDSDVIIQFNGVPIRSTLEFFEKTWDKVGESVELEVLRARTGDQLNLTTMIGELTPDKCNRWLAGAARIHAYSLPWRVLNTCIVSRNSGKCSSR